MLHVMPKNTAILRLSRIFLSTTSLFRTGQANFKNSHSSISSYGYKAPQLRNFAISTQLNMKEAVVAKGPKVTIHGRLFE